MTVNVKRSVIFVATLILSVLSVLWFLQNFEQVPTSHWQPAEKEAQRNPYLALERLLMQLARPVTRLMTPGLLDTLPVNGVLILDSHRQRIVDPARTVHILDWVKRGGYLIVAAEHNGNDPLLASLGLSRYKRPAQPVKPDNLSVPVEFDLPVNGVHYRIHRTGTGMISAFPKPDWYVADHECNVLLHYHLGQGQITVLDSLEFLDNHQIGDFDHAELIWALLRQYQPAGKIYLATRMVMPTLWQWMREYAWMVLISTAMLIGFWLWRIMPRFGGTLPAQVAERRALTAHLAAIARCVWREGGIEHWLTVVRQALQKQLLQQRLGGDASQQRVALAKIAECTTKDIWSALTPGQAYTQDSFTRAMQILQRLNQRL